MTRATIDLPCGLYPKLYTWQLETDSRFPYFGRCTMGSVEYVFHLPTGRVAGVLANRAKAWAFCRALSDLAGDWSRPDARLLREAEDIARAMGAEMPEGAGESPGQSDGPIGPPGLYRLLVVVCVLVVFSIAGMVTLALLSEARANRMGVSDGPIGSDWGHPPPAAEQPPELPPPAVPEISHNTI